MSAKQLINHDNLPKHIAIIMDGNGRWAKSKGKLRVFGHQQGVHSLRNTVEAAAELGVNYLTMYAFSTENWNRPKKEVDALMKLLVEAIKKETPTLMKNQIRLAAIGNLEQLPAQCQIDLKEAIKKTENNTRLTLVLALSYSSKWEIVNAFQKMMQDVTNGHLQLSDVNEKNIDLYLTTRNMPDPELLIRTGGEHRISNFLLWQIAYAELYFTDKLWPEFGKEDLYEAVVDFQKRERRFGKISEQLIK